MGQVWPLSIHGDVCCNTFIVYLLRTRCKSSRKIKSILYQSPTSHYRSFSPRTQIKNIFFTLLNQEIQYCQAWRGEDNGFLSMLNDILKIAVPCAFQINIAHYMKDRGRGEMKTEGRKFKSDDSLIRMCRKPLQLPLDAATQQWLLMDTEGVDPRGGLILHPRTWPLYPGNVTLWKAGFFEALIEFTENACLQNEISPGFTVQRGSLDRMSRGPFLLIKGGREPLGVRDCKQSKATVTKKPLPSAPLSSGHKGRRERSC